MNVPAPINYIKFLSSDENRYPVKVTTQIKDLGVFGDNNWHNVVMEILDAKTPLTTKQINPVQRVIVEFVMG